MRCRSPCAHCTHSPRYTTAEAPILSGRETRPKFTHFDCGDSARAFLASRRDLYPRNPHHPSCETSNSCHHDRQRIIARRLLPPDPSVTPFLVVNTSQLVQPCLILLSLASSDSGAGYHPHISKLW